MVSRPVRQRTAVLHLWEKGTSKRGIAKALDIKRYIVQRIIKSHEDDGGRKPRGRPRTARTAAVTNEVRRKLRRNPERNIRKLSRDHNISPASMHRLVRKDLKLKSLKKSTAPMLTDTTKKRRLERAQQLYRLMESHGDNVVFSDEKLFSISQAFNRQNTRVIAASRKDIPPGAAKVRRQKNAKSVMVWAAVSAKWKSKLVFLPEGAKITAKLYQDHVLKGAVLKAAKGLFRGKRWMFTQDGAPSHTARTTKQWFTDNEVPLLANWPPSSPDLNPLDFFVWNELQQKACAKPHDSVKSLKEALKKAWAEIPQKAIAKACRTVPKRIQQVKAAKGEIIDK